jgi:hypothetical protein
MKRREQAAEGVTVVVRTGACAVDDFRSRGLPKGNVHLAAAALAVAGLLLLYACSGGHSLLREQDALLGLSNRTVLMLLALLHLGVCGWLLAARDATGQGLVMLWLGVNCLVYRLGMAWLKAATPLPVVKLLAWKLGASAHALDIGWRLFIAYLVVGSVAHLLLERRRLRQMQSDAFLRHWKEVREHRAAAEG